MSMTDRIQNLKAGKVSTPLPIFQHIQNLNGELNVNEEAHNHKYISDEAYLVTRMMLTMELRIWKEKFGIPTTY